MKIIGIILVVSAVICIFVGRSNSAKLQDIKAAVEDYQEEHPIWSIFVPIPEEAQNEASSAASFAYSFTPPLTGMEILVYLALIAGVILIFASSSQTKADSKTR